MDEVIIKFRMGRHCRWVLKTFWLQAVAPQRRLKVKRRCGSVGRVLLWGRRLVSLPKWLGAVTPLGGLALIIGWLWLTWSLVKAL